MKIQKEKISYGQKSSRTRVCRCCRHSRGAIHASHRDCRDPHVGIGSLFLRCLLSSQRSLLVHDVGCFLRYLKPGVRKLHFEICDSIGRMIDKLHHSERAMFLDSKNRKTIIVPIFRLILSSFAAFKKKSPNVNVDKTLFSYFLLLFLVKLFV